MLNNEEYFERALGSDLQLLGRIPPKAVRDYFHLYSQMATAHSKRSQASLIHDHMIDWAGRDLPAEFRRIDVQQRILFNYRDMVLLQFNKLESKSRRAATNSSLQALLFDEHGEVGGLPGIRDVLPLITIGYVFKEDGVNLEGVYAVQFIGGTPDWIKRLDDEEGDAGNIEPMPQPHAPTNPPSRIKRPRVDHPDILEFGSGQS